MQKFIGSGTRHTFPGVPYKQKSSHLRRMGKKPLIISSFGERANFSKTGLSLSFLIQFVAFKGIPYLK